MKKAKAPSAIAPSATPIPIPAFALVERPDEAGTGGDAVPVPVDDGVELVPVDVVVPVTCAMLYPLICMPQAGLAVVYEVVAVIQSFDWSRIA